MSGATISAPIRAVRVDVAGDRERGDTVRRGDQRRNRRGQEDQREYVTDAVERRPYADAAEQFAGDDRFERIADRDRGRNADRRVARRIGQERADCDGGPEPAPEEEEDGDRDSGRSPNRRDHAVGHG
jgi:hypothetical protein